MSQHLVRGLGLVFGVLLSVGPALAHHAFATEFDANKPVTFRGFVTKIEWTNPHAWFYVNVKDESGKVENWGFEMGAPGALGREGLRRETLKIGDEVIVEGSLARNGSNRVNAKNLTLVSTGKKYGTASSQGSQNQ